MTPLPADGFEELRNYREYAVDEMIERSRQFAEDLKRRRTTRHFSDRPVPREVIEHCIRAAGSAPSGAHQQPWHFVVVSDPALKRRLREAAEEAEREFYSTAPADWLAGWRILGGPTHWPRSPVPTRGRSRGSCWPLPPGRGVGDNDQRSSGEC